MPHEYEPIPTEETKLYYVQDGNIEYLNRIYVYNGKDKWGNNTFKYGDDIIANDPFRSDSGWLRKVANGNSDIHATYGSVDMFRAVKDDGKERVQAVPNGAVREQSSDKPAIHLIPPYPLQRLGMHYTNGAKKYAERNWEKGLPLSSFVASLCRHVELWKMGNEDEDHEAAIAWNIFGFMHTQMMIRAGVLPEELDDWSEVVEQYRKVKPTFTDGSN